MLKRIVALLLVLVLTLSFVACDKFVKGEVDDFDYSSSTTKPSTTKKPVTTTQEETESGTQEEEEETTNLDDDPDRVPVKIEVTTPPAKMNYYYSDKFDWNGMIVTATYDDESTSVITKVGIMTDFASGSGRVVLLHGDLSTTLQVNVEPDPVLRGIEVVAPPNTTQYAVEPFNRAGLVVQAVFDKGDPVVITDYTDDYQINQQGAQNVCLFYRNPKNVNEVFTTFVMIEAVPGEPEKWDNCLGIYSSRYDASLANRTNNLQLACQAINGVILQPGQTFSYNQTLGPRTYERGYKDAIVFQGNKQVAGVGGGICQVSSTLFNSVLLANLEIVERRNHSLRVNYVPLGQDATVDWGAGIDFKFKNNYDVPILLQASASGGTVTTAIYATSRTYMKPERVEVQSGARNGGYVCIRYVNGVDNYTTYSRYGN